MEYKNLLNNYRRLIVNVKKYYDFIGYRVPFIRGVENYNFKPEHYEYLKLVVLEDGIYINTDLLVEHLSSELSFIENKTEEEIQFYLKSVRLTKPEEVFNEFPELAAYYDEWHKKNQDEIDQIMQQTTSKYKRYGEEIRLQEHMIKTGKIRNSWKVREKITKLKAFRSNSLNSIIESEILNAFVNYLSFRIEFLAAYKNNRNIKVSNENDVIVNRELLYYYLAKILFDKTSNPDLETKRLESIKKYIAKYLYDQEQNINSDNKRVIICKDRYMDERVKIYDMSDFKKLVRIKTLKKS